MKKLSFIDKIIFFFNSLAALGLVIEYALRYISPINYPITAVFTLGTPVVIIINIVFVIYWVIKLKKQFLLSTIVLLAGFSILHSFVKFSKKSIALNNDVKIMSYNVRLFNAYGWSKKDSLNFKIYQLIKDKDPDILAIQEFYPEKKLDIKYPYSVVIKNSKNSAASQAFYSKYKIIKKGSLNFVESGNNGIFADIVIQKDTIRFYNIHLQSFSIDTRKENFGEKDSESLLNRFKYKFKQQADQTELILEHQEKSPYRTIIIGDFNNNAFSWVYRKLKDGKKDAFLEAGSGLGKSFNYFFPLRIDFILTEPEMKVNSYKTYHLKYSDHFPIMARINLEKNIFTKN